MIMQKKAGISFFACMFFSFLSMAADKQVVTSQPGKQENRTFVLCGDQYTCVECRLDYCETVYYSNPFLYVGMCLGLVIDRRIPNKKLIAAQTEYDTAIMQLKTGTVQSEISDNHLTQMLVKIQEERKKEDATSTMICCCDFYRESKEKSLTACCCGLCECRN